MKQKPVADVRVVWRNGRYETEWDTRCEHAHREIQDRAIYCEDCGKTLLSTEEGSDDEGHSTSDGTE